MHELLDDILIGYLVISYVIMIPIVRASRMPNAYFINWCDEEDAGLIWLLSPLTVLCCAGRIFKFTCHCIGKVVTWGSK